MSDLLQSIAYALQFSEKKAVLVTDKNIGKIEFPGIIQELQDYIHSPEYKQLMIKECQQNQSDPFPASGPKATLGPNLEIE